MNKVKNHLLFLLYTVILGMIVGAIVWGSALIFCGAFFRHR